MIQHWTIEQGGAESSPPPREIGGRKLTTPAAFRDALIDELAMGREALPVGEACEGFDYKRGCVGHFATRSGA